MLPTNRPGQKGWKSVTPIGWFAIGFFVLCFGGCCVLGIVARLVEVFGGN